VWFVCGRVYCDLLSIIFNSSILFVLETPDDGWSPKAQFVPDLYRSRRIDRIMKSRKLCWTGHVARMGRIKIDLWETGCDTRGGGWNWLRIVFICDLWYYYRWWTLGFCYQSVSYWSYKRSTWNSRRGFRWFTWYHTDSEAHPASYPVGTRGSFLGVKRPGREADHSHPSSAEVKNAWSYTSVPQYAFMVWCSVKKGCGFHEIKDSRDKRHSRKWLPSGKLGISNIFHSNV
jgi:hypothetical protein